MSKPLPALKVIALPLEEVKVYEKNAKKHTKSQIADLANQIKEHGWDVPIVVDKKNVIIKGHGRWAAAQLLGLEKVPVIVRDDLTPSQVRAARLADNKLAEKHGGYDLTFLEEEIRELFQDGFNLELTGLESFEIKAFTVGDDLDVGAGTAPDKPSQASSVFSQQVRMVQIFLSDEGYRDFMNMTQALLETHGMTNLTDLMMRLIRAEYHASVPNAE